MKKILYTIFAVLALNSCGQRLVIVHTNDTHSHLEPIRSGVKAGLGGAIERAAYIDSIRAVYGNDNVLLVHAGDFSQGSSYFTELKGEIEDKVVNAMGYDCVTLGNHEFDNGIEALEKRVAGLQCPVVCANVRFEGSVLDSLVKPFTILRKGGKKIGIIGLETDLGVNVLRSVSECLRPRNPVEETNRWAEHLRKNEKCDLVIVLSHRGYEEDQRVASLSRNVDIVIGGHTHTFVDEMIYVKNLDGKDVPVVTDGCWGLEMGKIEVR